MSLPSIEGSEEVWSAIVASVLTHIAVFVPLLFLTGVSSILFKQLSIVVIFSLLMSLLVGVTLVPVLCAYLLKLPLPADQRKGIGGKLFTASEKFLDGMDEGYRRLLHKALVHRPIVIGAGVLSVVAAVLMFPLLNTELAPQTDEGVVSVSAELAAGTRIERTDAIMSRLEQMTRQLVPEAQTMIASAGVGGGGGGGMGGGGTSRGFIQLFLVPKDERERSSDQVAFDLRRQLGGHPGRDRPRQRQRRQQPDQPHDVGRYGRQRRRTNGRGNPRRGSRGRAPSCAGRAGTAAGHSRHCGSTPRSRRSPSRTGCAGRSAQSGTVRA